MTKTYAATMNENGSINVFADLRNPTLVNHYALGYTVAYVEAISVAAAREAARELLNLGNRCAGLPR